jgi:hypothetical protein
LQQRELHYITLLVLIHEPGTDRPQAGGKYP